MILQKVKAMVHTRPEATIEESFSAHQKTSDEREAQELQYKLEAIRFVLESCIDEAGFQKEKLGFVSDMIRSMGLDWEKTLDRNWNGSVYAFRIFTRNCSQTLRKQLAAAGVELDKPLSGKQGGGRFCSAGIQNVSAERDHHEEDWGIKPQSSFFILFVFPVLR